MGFIDFEKMAASGDGAGGDYLKFRPGETTAVYILGGPKSIPNTKFPPFAPQSMMAVWNIKEGKVQAMSLKVAIKKFLIALNTTMKKDWLGSTIINIQRTGSGIDDSYYTAFHTPGVPLADYENVARKGMELLAKLSAPKTAETLQQQQPQPQPQQQGRIVPPQSQDDEENPF